MKSLVITLGVLGSVCCSTMLGGLHASPPWASGGKDQTHLAQVMAILEKNLTPLKLSGQFGLQKTLIADEQENSLVSKPGKGKPKQMAKGKGKQKQMAKGKGKGKKMLKGKGKKMAKGKKKPGSPPAKKKAPATVGNHSPLHSQLVWQTGQGTIALNHRKQIPFISMERKQR